MNSKTVIIALSAGLLGAIGMYGVQQSGMLGGSDGSTSSSESAEKKVLYWVAPMDPNFRSDNPGKSPMGMDLIPVYEGQENNNDDSGAIKIKASVVNNIGVRTAPVERLDLSRNIETVGYLDYDESKIQQVHVRSDGWIEKLAVKSVGERVKQGQLLFEYYSPDLANAQAEYLQALQTGRKGLIAASAERLRALDFGRAEINALRKDRKIQRLIKVRAPQGGVVSSMNVRDGMYITQKKSTFTLADLSSVWLLADVFEDQAQAVEVGQDAIMNLSYAPGKHWEGKVEYIYPTLDAKARTLKVRLKFDNPNEELKPNMYAKVSIYGVGKDDVLTVPREAVIRSGKTDRLILSLGGGRFKSVEVISGIEANQRVEIKKGISENDTVVTSGQFLIDSEASLSASIQRLSDTEEASEGDEIAAPSAMAKVNTLMTDHGMVNLTHEPIPSIGWPSMTMDFKLLQDASLEGLKENDSVHITLAQDEEGMWGISKIMAMSGPKIEAYGEGVINSVSVENGIINMKHAPIPEIGWPEMEMDFIKLGDFDIAPLKAGDKIRFGLSKDAEGMFGLGSVEVMEKGSAQ
ncbi:efflux RND transporter periplasmic adaptor subunit [Magnetovibrio sp. PR-2]|uniref:efflux RND transporter periplasmic adaptor subunit n=1 Tax=Magnetovibrio sp. PR-2 TaxID=3120356 RepID=UPI002FCE27A1